MEKKECLLLLLSLRGFGMKYTTLEANIPSHTPHKAHFDSVVNYLGHPNCGIRIKSSELSSP